MKTTITILGIAALLFTTNTKAANEFKAQDLNEQDSAAVLVDNGQQENQLVTVNQEFSTNSLENTSDETAIFDPNSVVKATFQKTAEEIIAEDKLITESKEVSFQPLSLEKTMEDFIAEDNQIIESTVINEVYPLDFEKINRAVKSKKVGNNNLAVTVDLKL
ncbi:hypothetical protein [Flavobacterium sp.]|uniref:hypothetical protein n=1 Tax=Flavobacterium sp. TaxID=239 RepID=UPI002FD8F746